MTDTVAEPVAIEPIAAGGRLVHVGPHKTGTTTVQIALYAARSRLLEQGVLHAGRSRNPAAVIRSRTGRATDRDELGTVGYSWASLTREMREARVPRVVLSSEVLADALEDAIPSLVDELGGEAVHVVVTLRPLPKVLPSQWQQYVQRGLRRPFDAWLEAVLLNEDPSVTPSFWWRHRHDELIARWARVVGAGRVTAVVVDDRDPGFVLRSFEALLGVRDGTLTAERDLANRSMTLPEIECIRQLNIVFREAGLPKDLHGRIVLSGAAAHMKLHEPSPDWPRIEVPQWALDRSTALAAEMVAAIRASGVRVIGDLDSLMVAAPSRLQDDRRPEVSIPPEVAANMAMGVLMASGLARRGTDGTLEAAGGGRTFFEPPAVARIPTYQLAGVVALRAREAVVRRARRLLGRDAG